MKKVIIGVHGLGNKPPKYLLQKWWKDAMLEGFNLSGIKKDLPHFEMVYWADILYEKPLNKWEKRKNKPFYLDEPYTKAARKAQEENHFFQKKIISFIAHRLNKIFLRKDKTLNYSYITGAIMRRYFRDLEIYYKEKCKEENSSACKARKLIRNRLVETIKKYKDCEIFIIAHSMGSIITFDVLTFLVREVEINTLVTIGSPLGLPIIISKIAAEQKKKLNGYNIMATPVGITNNWFNLADIRDHIALKYQLADDFIKNDKGVFPTDFLVNNNYEINKLKNPHKSFGYLRTPEFSKILSDFIGEDKLNVRQKVAGKVQNIVGRLKEQSKVLKDKLSYTEAEDIENP